MRLREGLAARDCEVAFDAAWRLYAGELFAFIAGLGVPLQDVEDVVVRTFVKSIEQFQQYEDISFHRWLLCRARYQVLEHRKRRARQRPRELPFEDASLPWDVVEQVFSRLALREFLAALSDLDREILAAQLSPETDEEVAVRLGKKRQTIRNRRRLFRERLAHLRGESDG